MYWINQLNANLVRQAEVSLGLHPLARLKSVSTSNRRLGFTHASSPDTPVSGSSSAADLDTNLNAPRHPAPAAASSAQSSVPGYPLTGHASELRSTACHDRAVATSSDLIDEAVTSTSLLSTNSAAAASTVQSTSPTTTARSPSCDLRHFNCHEYGAAPIAILAGHHQPAVIPMPIRDHTNLWDVPLADLEDDQTAFSPCMATSVATTGHKSPRDTMYQLADFLDQVGRDTRTTEGAVTPILLRSALLPIQPTIGTTVSATASSVLCTVADNMRSPVSNTPRATITPSPIEPIVSLPAGFEPPSANATQCTAQQIRPVIAEGHLVSDDVLISDRENIPEAVASWRDIQGQAIDVIVRAFDLQVKESLPIDCIPDDVGQKVLDLRLNDQDRIELAAYLDACARVPGTQPVFPTPICFSASPNPVCST